MRSLFTNLVNSLQYEGVSMHPVNVILLTAVFLFSAYICSRIFSTSKK